MTKVVIIEYGVGNLGSVIHACRRAGCEPQIVGEGRDLKNMTPSHIILPGVGAVGEALAHLRERDLVDPLSALAHGRKIPTLAICAGMQMLAETCSEFGEYRGLGWIPSAITNRIAPKGRGVRMPHMGWNNISVLGDHGGLLAGLESEHFYFLHSYAMSCDPAYTIAQADYHGSITAGVRNENIFGVQFHPEKSNRAGTRLMSNFFALSV